MTYLNLSKASYRVNGRIGRMMTKIQAYGIDGKVNNWIKA